MSKALVGVVLLSSLACAHPRPAPPKQLTKGDYTYTKEYATWLIQEKMRTEDIVGLSIALVDDQSVVWAEGFGYADQEKKISANADTVYRSGSVSKLFTALAVMQLAEQDKLDIDQPITQYIPEFSVKTRFDESPFITSRMLMTHQSGLFGDYFSGMLTPKPKPICSLLDDIKDEYVAYPPNLLMSYSNTGISILGCVVETITKTDFNTHLGEAILAPLQMSNSTFESAPPKETRAYEGESPKEELPVRDTPAMGLNTTVYDLSHFMKMIFAGGRFKGRRLIQRDTLNKMFEPQNKDNALDLDTQIGLAWFLGGPKIPGATKIVSHDGATLYHRALFMALPEQKLGVIILSNSIESSEAVQEIATEVLQLAIASKSGAIPPRPEQTKPAPPTQTIRELEGRYATAGGLLEIEKKRNKYHAKLNGKRLSLLPQSNGIYKTRIKLLRVIPFPVPLGFFLQDIEGRETLILQGSKRQLFAEKIEPAEVPPAWKKREGEYTPIIPKGEFQFLSSITIKYKDGNLLAFFQSPTERKPAPFILEPVSSDEAYLAGLGRHLGETIRVIKKGGKEVLRYQGYDWVKQ